jgi:RNA polymerase sigma-70 factor (ECF subfamily)
MLDRVRAADPQAWQRLVHLYSPLVFAWCQRAGLSAEDAADVMQEVWGAVCRAIGGFDHAAPGATFRGWLYTITRNKVRDFYRGAADRPRAEGGSTAHSRMAELPESEPSESQADPVTGMAGLMRRVLELVRQDFEGQTFRAFWRTAVDDRPAAEVAAELGMTVDAVYQAKSRVLRRLREELGSLMPDFG